MILLYGSRPRSNPAQLWGCVELDSCTGVLGTVDTLCHKCGYPPLVFFSSFTFSFLASLHEFRSALDTNVLFFDEQQQQKSVIAVIAVCVLRTNAPC